MRFLTEVANTSGAEIATRDAIITGSNRDAVKVAERDGRLAELQAELRQTLRRVRLKLSNSAPGLMSRPGRPTNWLKPCR